MNLVERLRYKYADLLHQEAADEIERLRDALDNEQAKGVHSCGPNCQRPLCVANRIIETQKQYCANKDSVIAGLITQIKTLEGDLEVMRLQRDATQSSRCPNCERLRGVYEAAKALAKEVDVWAEDAGGYAPAWFDLEEALRKDD